MADRVLLVDDSQLNLKVLSETLGDQGFELLTAGSGEECLQVAGEKSPNLILLDIVMGGMDGFETCKRLKEDPATRKAAVIFMSSLDEAEKKVQGLQLGAVDYICKPFDRDEVIARVNTHMEILRLHREVIDAHAETAQLLLNLLPTRIADRLQAGESPIADEFETATVLFAEVVDYDEFVATLTVTEAVARLNEVISLFDHLAVEHGVEKVKTMGDVYLAVAGVPEARTDHAVAAADLALAMQREACKVIAGMGAQLGLRIGISSGPVVAGVVGRVKFSYDVWGDTVRLAYAMAETGVSGGIQVSAATRDVLADTHLFEDRGAYFVEGQGEVKTYLLTGRL